MTDQQTNTDGGVDAGTHGPGVRAFLESERTETDRETRPGLGRRLAHDLRRDRRALFGTVVVALFVVTAVFAPQIAMYNPDRAFIPFVEPLSSTASALGGGGSALHVLGTDSYGYDIFSRLVYGARVSLIVAFATVAFAFVVGTVIGLVAGFYGGWVDSVLMRYIDFQWAFPELILAVGLIAVTGGTGLLNVVIAIGIAYIDDFARIIRGEVISIRQKEYVTAARSIGMSNRRIMFREILPNAVAPLIVQATVMIPLAILAEAGLSFLGLGVDPTRPTWGIMISEGRDFIGQAWWISVLPGLAIMVTVLAFNLLGDGLRDVFDVTEMGVDR